MLPSIHKKLYSRGGSPYLISAALSTIVLILLMVFISPASVLIEIVAVGLVTGIVFFLMKGFFNNTKWTWIVPIGLLGFLMMSRWGILDYLMAGLWIAVLILISLFN